MATNARLLTLIKALTDRVTFLENNIGGQVVDLSSVEARLTKLESTTCPEEARFVALETALAANNGVDAKQAADLGVLTADHQPL